jgi:hypothetical protein
MVPATGAVLRDNVEDQQLTNDRRPLAGRIGEMLQMVQARERPESARQFML